MCIFVLKFSFAIGVALAFLLKSNKCTESLLNQQFLFFNRIFLPAKWCDFNQKTAHSTTRSNVKWKNVEIRGQNVYGGVQWKIESFVSIRSNAFNCRKLPWLNNTIATEWENHPKIAKTVNCAGGTQQSIPFHSIQLSLHVRVLTRLRWMTNYKKTSDNNRKEFITPLLNYFDCLATQIEEENNHFTS